MLILNLLTPDEVAEVLKVGRRIFMRTVAKQPGFPAPVRLGRRMLRWHSEEIEQWAQQRRDPRRTK